MSAPLKMTPREVQLLAEALTQFTQTTRSTGVRFDSYESARLRVSDESTLDVRWDDEEHEYVIDDQVGS